MFRCPKCAYVLLNYYAYLSTTAVDEVISEKGLNIFDLEENQLTFRELAGLEDKKPFECVGQFEEAKLAFILCKIKGLTGKAIDKVTEQLSPEELDHIVSTFTSIEREDILIPEQIWKRLEPVLVKHQQAARSYITDLLSILQSSTSTH